MLQKINRELIRLLGQKMTLSSHLEPDVDLTHLLAENGVPEFVWNNLELTCKAAEALPTPSLDAPRQITIIGGCGKLGRFFSSQATHFGCFVKHLNRENWSDASQLLGQADLVLIAVPIEQTLTIVEQASQFLAPSTVLADLTSIKTPIVKAMLEHHSGPVLGLHPMFGPGVQSFLGQNVVVCPGRNLEAGQWFLDFLEQCGARLTICPCEKHDRLMVHVQAIRHFISFSLGVFLAQEEIDLHQTLNFASPLYRLQLDLVSRLFAQDCGLSFKLMLASPEHQAAITRLEKTISDLAQAIANHDLTTLKQAFDQSRCLFEQDANRAQTESNYLIDSLSIFLTAQEIETQRTHPSNLKSVA